jgi:hypothetical protein
MRDRKLLYSRTLPGGGHVTIEVESQDSAIHAMLFVERRVDPLRRDGHLPPVVAEALGDSETTAFDALYPIAASNVQLAQRIMRWQASRRD